MNKFCVLIFLLLPILAFGKTFKIEKFSSAPHDITARTNPRQTLDGKYCGLLKVQCATEKVTFEGNVVGDVIEKTSEYWVYLSPETDFLIVKHPGYTPLIIYFEDFLQNSSIEQKCTYIMALSSDNNEFSSEYSEKSTGSENGRKYIDLGLSVNWALCNVGAEKPEEQGLLVAWGETSTKSNFSENNYKFYTPRTPTEDNYSEHKILKYQFDDERLGGKRLQATDDVASRRWGGRWRMPTAKELEELRKSCTFFPIKYHDHSGYVVTGPNGNTIFLPHETENSYWSGELGGSTSGGMGGTWNGDCAAALRFYEQEVLYDFGDRYEGNYVRPVIDKNTKQ